MLYVGQKQICSHCPITSTGLFWHIVWICVRSMNHNQTLNGIEWLLL